MKEGGREERETKEAEKPRNTTVMYKCKMVLMEDCV